MTSIRSTFLFLLTLMFNTLIAQDLKVVHISGHTLMNPGTYEVMDEVPQEIFQYNYLCKFLDIEDTISIEKLDNGYKTIYKGEPFDRQFKNGKYSSNGLTLESNMPYEDYFFFKATLKMEDNLDYCFTFFKRDSPFKDFEHKNDEGVSVYYKSHLKYIGEFKHYTINGELYENGNYCQVDTNYIDTVTILDPKTYETKITITNHIKKSSKCGEWTKNTDNQ